MAHSASIELRNAEERNKKINQLVESTSCKRIHPRSEHLVPLFVAAGAAGNDMGYRDYSGILLRASISAFKFG
jgi:aromatic ring-opening dioxygenase catalytic subunit (LigB family)